MPSSETIRTDLEVLKASRCYAASAAPTQCPHRAATDAPDRTQACARCRLACARVMALVTERVWSVACKCCDATCREDLAADVTAEFVERLVSGDLLRSWTAAKPVLAIASRAFIYKRIVSAGRTWARQHREESSFDVIGVQVEYADHSEELEGYEIAERYLRESLRPETWTGGHTVELTAAVQLFPILREAITANRIRPVKPIFNSAAGLAIMLSVFDGRHAWPTAHDET